MREVIKLMETHGVTCTLRQFQESINLTFHRHESAVYDHLHECMWKSLPPVFEALAAAAETRLSDQSMLRLLDVGAEPDSAPPSGFRHVSGRKFLQ
ncbi:MAG: hypothetical protein M3N93_11845 [Acidobacteriota bacterium]|nr:hypothetical protein [Acidobacteriota bacterium]